ncbi:hypothetical protein [Lactobacillus helveticus]|uniref:hypothetical protein n=1 Tax=Lactobacillus helveticus TaxID=1587 RepID=UPI000ABFC1BB|nr:hypothetical protein [Lactobacillus helveticus]
MAKKRKTSENNRKFKGVWIPAKYWLDENLTIMEVVLITEIDSLDGENGCFASNKHFADFLGMFRDQSKKKENLYQFIRKNNLATYGMKAGA